MSSSERLVHLLLRIGAAFAFMYPPLRALVDPITWLGYIPSIVRTLPAQLGFPLDPLVLLHAFGVIEVALALWMLFGRNARIPAALMTFILLAIVAFNFADMDILFRDLSIAAMTLALVFWPNVKEIASAPPAQRP
ncbi:hypothetical protein A3J11_00655 [Candidatus Kaiserbacteria bacterium RIFCSPLOWO2_02_FULL_55_12]|uniref:DoxX family protein n=2 Tax=Candidatus Kaiseribacteriota TaxID=1752734 RepID=A0A1F6EYV0_9BACT|nr:MAG: hypothetical protein A3C94_01885 [Candidatus Kaiserbacteria bacterium RIFCSPHIGHO2_02_FULL_55_17]OGG78797.1 MAG: hypothetical protein A3J11_00655 [Candidatus Kaiserbacteria bacterium RIFCSPLOWO2_02_FULL_55_12]